LVNALARSRRDLMSSFVNTLRGRQLDGSGTEKKSDANLAI
jgi:hypothetical protein